MKSKNKVLGIIALIAVIGFSMTACPDGGGVDPELPGTITISPPGPVTIGTELTATYSGEETVSYQWRKGAADVGTNSNKFTPTEAGSYTVTVSAEGFISITSSAVTVTDPSSDNDGWISGDVWLKTKETKYTVADGEVGDAKVADTEWIIYKYASNTKYEQKSILKDSTGEMTTYIIRDGQNELNTMEGTFIYGDTEYPFFSKNKNVYDSDTGLMVSKTISIKADGEESEPKENPIELVSNIGGIKTYKHITQDGGIVFTNKIQDGRIIEKKAEIELWGSSSYTLTYTFPTNNVIRTKLPDFTLESMKGDGGMYGDYYQEVEVLSDDSSALVIQVKKFSKSNYGIDPKFELEEQTDIRYEKFSTPLSK